MRYCHTNMHTGSWELLTVGGGGVMGISVDFFFPFLCFLWLDTTLLIVSDQQHHLRCLSYQDVACLPERK